MECKRLAPVDLDRLPLGARVRLGCTEWRYEGQHDFGSIGERRLFSNHGKACLMSDEAVSESDVYGEAGSIKVMAPRDVRDLSNPWKSRLGEIEGLTPKLEVYLKQGAYVVDMTIFAVAAEDDIANGRIPNDRLEFSRQMAERMMKGHPYSIAAHDTGGSTWHEMITKEEYEVAVKWRRLECFPEATEGTARENFEYLMGILRERNITFGIENPPLKIPGIIPWFKRYMGWLVEEPMRNYCDFQEGHGEQYMSIAQMIEILPESATRNVKSLISGCYVSHGYGENNNGVVMISNTVMSGPRRLFSGIVLHEIGHSAIDHLEAADRAALDAAYNAISRHGDVMKTNYIGPSYVNRQDELKEFIPEVFMAYVSQGTRLRDHIAESRCKGEWETVYNIFKEKVFSGIEYV